VFAFVETNKNQKGLLMGSGILAGIAPVVKEGNQGILYL